MTHKQQRINAGANHAKAHFHCDVGVAVLPFCLHRVIGQYTGPVLADAWTTRPDSVQHGLLLDDKQQLHVFERSTADDQDYGGYMCPLRLVTDRRSKRGECVIVV